MVNPKPPISHGPPLLFGVFMLFDIEYSVKGLIKKELINANTNVLAIKAIQAKLNKIEKLKFVLIRVRMIKI